MQTKRKILSTVLLSILMLLALFTMSACGGEIDDILSLDAPQNIRYSGSAVTWDTVSGAAKYLVKINEGTEISVSTTSFSYSSKADFSISVKAVSSSGKVVSEASVMSFKYLGAVQSLEVLEDGTVTWAPVDGATSYLLSLDGEEIAIGNTLTYSGFTTGLHTISVRPVVDGDSTYFSPWSTPTTLTVLGTVDAEQIAYDGEYITFPSVTSASSYNIYIDGDIYEEKITTKKIAYDAGSTDFTVTIKAIGNPKNRVFDGEESAAKEFIFLDTVTGIRVEDGILKWDEVEKADTYQLMINGNVVEKNLTKAQYDNGKYLVSGKNLEISVKPISTDKSCFSDFSAPFSIFLLQTPTLKWDMDLSLDGGQYNIFWDEVNGAIGYEITVTDPDNKSESFRYGASEVHFAYDYEKVGTYTVTARALANEATDNIYSSLNSQEVVVIRPEDPRKSGSNFITSNPTDLSAGFTVTFEHNSKAKAYELYRNDLKVAESTKPQFIVTDLIKEDVIDGQEYQYSIKLMGSVRTVGGKITATLNSYNTLDFKITVLATPQNVKMEGYTVMYESVVGANSGYAITGAGSAAAVTETSTSRDLSGDLQSGNYNIQVCAKGNGSDVLASNYSPILKVHRLDAPRDIKIDTALSSNGILKYTIPDGTSSVEIYIDNVKIISVDDVINNMNKHISTSGTGVKMVAVANEMRADGIYYMSSPASDTKTFIKLQAPSNLTFDNTHLKWNMEGISSAATGLITYHVYNESKVLFTAVQNDRSIDISHLEGGRTYSFTIVARGDGEKYINSDPSSVADIYKLETPTVERIGNNYVWDGVSRSTSYSVAVDGVICDSDIHASNQQYTFNPASAFKDVKQSCKVTFTAIGDGGIETISSAPLEITQEIALMNKPDFALSYSGDVYDSQGQIIIKITKESPFATGYRYTINGVTYEKLGEGSTEYKHTSNQTGRFEIYVNAIGQTFDDNGVYLIDSQTVGGNEDESKYVMYLLNAPGDIQFQDGQVTFSGDKNADGYIVKVTLNGVSYQTKVLTPSFDVKKAIKAGNFEGISEIPDTATLKVEIYANADEINSNKVSSTTVTKTWSGNVFNK